MTESKSVALPLGDAPTWRRDRSVGGSGKVRTAIWSSSPPPQTHQPSRAMAWRRHARPPACRTVRSRSRRTRSCAPAGIPASRPARRGRRRWPGQECEPAVPGRSRPPQRRDQGRRHRASRPAGRSAGDRECAGAGAEDRGRRNRDPGIDQHDARHRAARAPAPESRRCRTSARAGCSRQTGTSAPSACARRCRRSGSRSRPQKRQSSAALRRRPPIRRRCRTPPAGSSPAPVARRPGCRRGRARARAARSTRLSASCCEAGGEGAGDRQRQAHLPATPSAGRQRRRTPPDCPADDSRRRAGRRHADAG